MFRIDDHTEAFDVAYRHGQPWTKYDYVVETEAVVCRVCRAHWRKIGEPFYIEDGHLGPDAPWRAPNQRLADRAVSEPDLDPDEYPPAG